MVSGIWSALCVVFWFSVSKVRRALRIRKPLHTVDRESRLILLSLIDSSEQRRRPIAGLPVSRSRPCTSLDREG